MSSPRSERIVDLCVGEATVKAHVSNLLSKLHLRERVQVGVYAHRHGLA